MLVVLRREGRVKRLLGDSANVKFTNCVRLLLWRHCPVHQHREVPGREVAMDRKVRCCHRSGQTQTHLDRKQESEPEPFFQTRIPAAEPIKAVYHYQVVARPSAQLVVAKQEEPKDIPRLLLLPSPVSLTPQSDILRSTSVRRCRRLQMGSSHRSSFAFRSKGYTVAYSPGRVGRISQHLFS